MRIGLLRTMVAGLLLLSPTVLAQPDRLNEDLNGVNGGITSDQTWAQFGAMSPADTPVSLAPVNPVPEPVSGTLFSVLGGMALLQLVVMRRRY